MMIKAIFAALCLLIILPKQAFAQTSPSSFITIVNPQRISEYTKDYLKSFQEEVDEIEQRSLPATWPVTYDILTKKDFVKALKNMDKNQELGIFLEVTPEFASAANVNYNKSDSWHRANSLFLSGYTQEDRTKLIDTVFKKFKKEFGYYPKSVGSWWTDSYSLSYMKEKYGITGTINVSDQYDLDGYSVWGTWWSVPYYPSRINAALPAQSEKNKLDIVTFRWAPRDPLNGYKSPTQNTASMYSTQDYPTLGIDHSYFESLVKLYAFQHSYNQFGQLTVGLEGDLPVENYSNQFAKQLDTVKEQLELGNIQVTTMQEFSSWYRKKFPNLSPRHVIASNDLLGEDNKLAAWIQTPWYRVGLIDDLNSNTTSIIDLRYYSDTFEEPFLKSPNKNHNFSINLPFTIDTIILPKSKKKLPFGDIQEFHNNKIVFTKGIIEFTDKKVLVNGKELEREVELEQKTFTSFSLTIPFSIKRRLSFLPSAIPFFTPHTYYISQAELDGLSVLKRLKEGRVLAYDKSCSKCMFTSQYKPSAAAGVKSYIAKYSSKPIQIDSSFLLSGSSKIAKNILKEKNIRYVYLSKYEDYIETLPYLPQDLGLVRVYENANTEIWKVE